MSLSAHHNLFWRSSHAKNLHRGGAQTRQTKDGINEEMRPWNCSWYADFDE
jgi:hypothetical protein